MLAQIDIHVEMPRVDADGDIVLCMSRMNLSAQACHCILKLARTIADLAGSEEIKMGLLIILVLPTHHATIWTLNTLNCVSNFGSVR